MNYRETNKLLLSRLQDALWKMKKSIFSVERLAEIAPNFPAFDALQDQEFIVFLEPPSLDARIVNQVALFSLISRPIPRLGAGRPSGRVDELRNAVQASRREDGGSYSKRVIVPAALKWEVRDKLDQANITERVLFPGLDGLSAWLKRHYTKRGDT